MRSLSLVTALIAFGLCTTASAQTTAQLHGPGGLFDATPHTRPTQVSGQLALYDGFGVGARFVYPLLPDGFLPEINDSFELLAGGEFYLISFWAYCNNIYSCYAVGPRLDVLGEARWTFHIWPSLAVYAKLSLGPTIPFGGAPPSLEVTGGPGAIYKVNDHMNLSGEFVSGFPYGGGGVRGGIDWNF